MARLMAIATHHKGGTIWIKSVIRALSKAMDIPWIGIWSERQMPKVPETGRAFLVNWAGHFPGALWARNDVSFAHIIRDPRDVLLSGCAYHKVAGVKGEGFLHEPRADLGGMTYQEHLNRLKDTEAELLFEMTNKHALTVQEMRAWPYDDPRTFELRYETLMTDTEGELFSKALVHLGLDTAEQAIGRQAFWDHSIFGGLAKSENRTGRLSNHIRSDGKLRRWERELPRSVGDAYARQFGDDLIALGYETDLTWAKRLPEAVPA